MDLTSFKEPQISDTEEYEKFSQEFDCYISFFYNLSELISYNGRIISFFTNKGFYELDTSLIDSSVQTLKNIKVCCSIGGFSDANTLIRKLRDDLLLYIFALDIINRRKPFTEDSLANFDINNAEKFAESFLNIRFNNTLSEDEQVLEAWFCNKTNELPFAKKKLDFANYMTVLKQNENIQKILSDYKLQDYWEKLRIRLNDYVHNNGKQFTRQNFITVNDKNIATHLGNINFRVSYISSFFLVLLLMVESSLISSTDLIDHLDCDMTPPEDCQYFIANFVQEFIDTKVIKLHPELKQFLKDNNNHGMKIE